MTDYQHLRELAEQATPGPWKHKDGLIDGPNYAEVIYTGPVDCMAYCYGGSSTIEWERDVDAEFVAAANPTVVLDLLDRIATLTTQVRNQAAELEDTRAAHQLTRHQLDALATATRAARTVADVIVVEELQALDDGGTS